MTVSLKNISGEPLYLGSADGRRVEVGEVIHVEGDLAKAKDQPEDAYLIGAGAAARVYPKALWSNAGGSRKADPDVPAPAVAEETS